MSGPSSSGPSGVEARRSSLATAIWVNGQRQTLEGTHVSARDRGFTLADGLFETILVRSGRAFRLDAHLRRLELGLAALEILVPSPLRSWVAMALEAASASDVDMAAADASLRLTVTRGASGGGLVPPPDAQPTVVVTLGPMPASSLDVRERGLFARVSSGRRNEHSMTSGLKTLSYTDSVAALIEARRAGVEEALFLDTGGHCSEATASNLFVWTGQEIVTPPTSCGALAGITRAAVMEVARRAGLSVAERAFGLEALLAAREAFLTSSLRGVAPLVRVDGRAIGDGAPGPRTRELADAYEALVTDECGA